MALLKKDHGIEVKSASSTIEEVVAREFVSKQARHRNIKIPSNASFADTPGPTKGAIKKPGGKAEPPKPAAPAMPAPRLVKTAKPASPPAAEPVVGAPLTAEPGIIAVPAATVLPEPPVHAEPMPPPPGPEPEPHTTAPAGATPVEPPPAPVVEHTESEPDAPVAEPPATTEAPAAATAGPAPIPRPTPTPGRIVPPTLRLRVEDP